ncbi:MAG: porin family protein [Candidatus Obscuribacterales bacterium]|nr:porin family protein [Steroidobacteraceae bacterium]
MFLSVNSKELMMRTVSIIGLLLIANTVAQAADNGVYLGAGVTRSTIDANSSAISQTITNVGIDDDDNGFKVIAGVRPLDWLAVEANYIDFGEVSTSTATTRTAYGLKGVDAFALLLIGPPFLDIYAKGGAIRWQAEGDITSALGTARDKESGFDVAYGAGVQARFGSLAARLEYERFEIDNTDETSALTLAVTWTFL